MPPVTAAPLSRPAACLVLRDGCRIWLTGRTMDEGDAYQELRPLLFSIAYRMVGSVSEAEDLVQEAYLRFHRAVAGGAEVDSPKAYLSTVTTRLAIDHLRSARVRREQYVGDLAAGAAGHRRGGGPGRPRRDRRHACRWRSWSCWSGCRRSQRAVFLLHEVFGYAYAEIAGLVGQVRGQPAARSRPGPAATSRPAAPGSRPPGASVRSWPAGSSPPSTRATPRAWSACWPPTPSSTATAAARPRPWPAPLYGAERVARFLVGLARRGRAAGIGYAPAEINGHPGLLTLDPAGRLLGVLALDIADGRVQTVRSIINPDKLRHLGPVGDLTALLGGG